MGLDTVDILMTWEQAFDISIPDTDAERLETPRMAVDYLCLRLDAVETGAACPTLRAFQKLRQGLCACSAVARSGVKLKTPLRRFYRGRSRQAFWDGFVKQTGFDRLRPPGWLDWTTTVADVLDDLMTRGVAHVRDSNEPWSRAIVRASVRTSVRQFVNRRFRDDEHFIRDLQLD